MTLPSSTRRKGIATHRVAALGAVAMVSFALFLTGCTADPSNPDGSSVPLPSPTGTWTPPPTDAPDGATTPAPVPTQDAAIDEPVDFETGITVSISKIETTSVTASTPGEISGPAVVVTVAVKNDSTAPINLDSAVVNLSADNGGYGVGTTAGKPVPLAGDLAPGKTAEGRYVFMLDPAVGRTVMISVNYGAGEPVAVFTGKTS